MKMIIAGGQPFFLPGGPFGCLLIHSFSCCPKEIRWLSTQLNEAGYTVLAIRLFGHATRPEDLHRARYQDWIANVEDGVTLLQQQCEKSIVIGISMGGALALIAGARSKIDGIVAIATPYSLPTTSRIGSLKILMPILHLVGLAGRPMMKSPFSHELDALLPADRLAYETFSPRVILEVNRLFSEMQHILPRISAPTLLIDGEEVGEGELTATSQILNHLSSKRTKLVKVRATPSETLPSPGQERISTAIIQFVASLSGLHL